MKKTAIAGTRFEEVEDAAMAVRAAFKIKSKPPVANVGVVLGSGLGEFANRLFKNGRGQAIDYKEIPHFPTSSVDGHHGRLVYGFIGEQAVLAMEGRVHCYEGYTAAQVAFPVRVLSMLGIKKLIVTNASGGMGDDLEPGDLMLISDHLNLTGDNPMLGPNDLRFGPRFFDTGDIYTKALRTKALEIAKSLEIPLKEGVYVGILGPNYETPAEIRAFKLLGGDAVGMSTIFESLTARHGGLELLGISCITNKAAGLSSNKLTHEEVTEIAKKSSGKFCELLFKLIPELFTK